uniref:ATP synthase subunit a n=1 Tax=Trixagus sp. TRI01 TaxID=1205587 RepID=A0A0S2MQA7_9COLE|nr:ATP synthase F0 subunit 6 [Trixagus sp. TRI01]
MMTNLFSSFDPSTSKLMAYNWCVMILPIILQPILFWIVPSRNSMLFKMMYKYINKELYSILNTKTLNINILMFSIMTFIMILNITSLFPFIFSCTSQISVSLSMALPMWLSLMIFGWTKNYYSMMAHLVPQGTPNMLMPFMVCIESVSNIIRPMTLSIRLSANMIAGHLLLTLLGSIGPNANSLIIAMLISSQLILITLESAVAIIQSYVFTILMSLYSSET